MQTIDKLLSARPKNTRGPRPLESIQQDIHDLLHSDAVYELSTARTLADLHKEAAPFEPDTRVIGLTKTGVLAVETRDNTIDVFIEINVATNNETGQTEHRTPAHAGVAAAFYPTSTQEALIDAIEKADRAGHWTLVEALGKALEAAYSGHRNIYDEETSPAAPRTFRLKQHNHMLAQNIQNAYEAATDPRAEYA